MQFDQSRQQIILLLVALQLLYLGSHLLQQTVDPLNVRLRVIVQTQVLLFTLLDDRLLDYVERVRSLRKDGALSVLVLQKDLIFGH